MVALNQITDNFFFFKIQGVLMDIDISGLCIILLLGLIVFLCIIIAIMYIIRIAAMIAAVIRNVRANHGRKKEPMHQQILIQKKCLEEYISDQQENIVVLVKLKEETQRGLQNPSDFKDLLEKKALFCYSLRNLNMAATSVCKDKEINITYTNSDDEYEHLIKSIKAMPFELDEKKDFCGFCHVIKGRYSGRQKETHRQIQNKWSNTIIEAGSIQSLQPSNLVHCNYIFHANNPENQQQQDQKKIKNDF